MQEEVGVLFLCIVASVLGGMNDAEFFRISDPSTAVITGFDAVAGTLTYSNTAAEVSNQLQRAYDLAGTSNWVDFVQLVSTSSVATETIIDLDSPEDMNFIPGGVFQMGDALGEGATSELPIHSIYVSGFYMGRYEVTKGLWDEVYNWATNHGYSFGNPGSGKASNHPVYAVSWYDVLTWSNARSEMEGRVPCYNLTDWSCNWNANGYRLPTEAEWEKAARGGLNAKRYGWGDLIAHSNANYDLDPAYNDGVYPYSSPVGSFAPNGYGLYDMVGNMREWCWDRYDSAYYVSSPPSNPRGAFHRVGNACRAAAVGATPPGTVVRPSASATFHLSRTTSSAFGSACPPTSALTISNPLISSPYQVNLRRTYLASL